MGVNKTETIVRQTFTEYLVNNKLRRTPERYAILSAIYSITGRFDVDVLMEYMESEAKFRVSRATIYNTISLLLNANLLTHHQFGNKSQYEKCYNNERYHLICNRCAKVTELSGNITDDLNLKIKKFQVTHYSLYIYGFCSKCVQALRRKKRQK